MRTVCAIAVAHAHGGSDGIVYSLSPSWKDLRPDLENSLWRLRSAQHRNPIVVAYRER